MAYGRARAEAVDGWLAGLFAAAAAEVPRRLAAGGLALVAVGGYGRQELCPRSDVDVMLLHNGGRHRDGLRAMAERIWYPVWDAGLKLGHAVRTPKEALALGAADLETATGLLELRLVAGDSALATEVADRAAQQWRARSAAWLKALAHSVADRHARVGEVAYLLEPDLKEGRGGLRDVHALRWAQAAEHVVDPEDLEVVEPAYDVLLGVRVELHRVTGRAHDRLLLQDQDAVAEALGDRDADDLVRRVAEAARAIAWTSDVTWGRVAPTLAGPRRRGPERRQPLGPGLSRRDDVVELDEGADVTGDPTLALRAAAATAAGTAAGGATATTTAGGAITAAATAGGATLARQALARLSAEAPPMPDPWPPGALPALLALLGSGPAAIPVLEALDHFSLLVRILPEWSAVRARPQRNALHRFTVDRHLCEAAAEAAALAPEVARPDLLLVGAWLHDLGKGFCGEVASGDHSEAGEVVVGRIATRMGFPPEDVAVLRALVRHHLLLARAATRRDVDDPATAEAVLAEVGDAVTLELLHALTRADGLATGPSAWSPWKAELVATLVDAVRRRLAGEAPAPHGPAGLTPHGPAAPTPAGPAPTAAVPAPAGPSRVPGGRDRASPLGYRDLVDAVAAGGPPVVVPDGPTVVVVAPDRPGLFCRVAGVLALHGLDVLNARGWSSEPGGVAVDELRVESVLDRPPDWGRVEADLRRSLTGRLALEAALADRARSYPRRPTTAARRRPAIVAEHGASDAATVVEVRAPDRTGTLYRITRALADLDLDIRYATVTTTGDELVDTFYVVDAAGSKLDAEQLAALERAVLVELDRV